MSRRFDWNQSKNIGIDRGTELAAEPVGRLDLATGHAVSSLWLVAFALLGLGIVQVYSSSYIFATENRGDGLYFVERQAAFALLSLFCMILFAFLPWKYLGKLGWLSWIVATLGIALTFIPSLGVSAGGARRWIGLFGGYVFEPAELIKVSLPLLMGAYVARAKDWLPGLRSWVKWSLLVALYLLPLVLLQKQPDFGTLVILVFTTFAIIFSIGIPWWTILASVATAMPAFYFLVMRVPYRRARIEAFLDPWAVADSKGFQVIQSMLSLRSGGIFGVGLGDGQSKLFFLPEAHTDFTLSVIGEELGFIGIAIVLVLYSICIFRAFEIARKLNDLNQKVVALGLGTIFGFNVIINIGVALGLFPTKGLTLPFLSYGGSSVIVSGILIGLLINLERAAVVRATKAFE